MSRTSVAGLALMLVAALAFAAPASTATPGVDDIVARYVAARGGLKKIRSIQTLRQTGQATGPAGRHALLTRELKRPGRVRFEYTVQGVTGVYASDGMRGWQISPFDAEMGPKPLPDEIVKDAIEQADIEGPLVDWKQKGHQVEIAGHETVEGHDTYKMKVTLKSGVVRYDYLDAKTYHLVRTETTRQARGGPLQVQTSFGDFGKVDGVLFPHTIEIGAVGRPDHLRVVVETIVLNPPLSDARFTMPANAGP